MSESSPQVIPELPGGSEPLPDWTPYLRAATEMDLPYIKSTWISAYRNSPWAGTVPNNLFDAVCTETFDQLMRRGMKLMVCSNPANPEQLLGWLAYETSPCAKAQPGAVGEVCVHGAFTKPTYRRLGVISHLLAAVPVVGSFFYSHRTANSRYLKGGVHRPEIARRKDWGTSNG